MLYPANLLTIARLLLVPIILRDLRYRERRGRAFAMIAAALFTDIIDGPIARSRGEVSNLGKVIDPITDKLLLNGSVITLSRAGEFPRWVAALLLIRDIAILLGGLTIYRRRTEIQMAQPLGKATTVAFGAALLVHLALGPRRGRPFFYVALLAMAGSVIQYARTLYQALYR